MHGTEGTEVQVFLAVVQTPDHSFTLRLALQDGQTSQVTTEIVVEFMMTT